MALAAVFDVTGVVVLPACGWAVGSDLVLSAIAAAARVPNEELVMIGFKKPSVVFYSHLPVTYIKETNAGISYVQKLLSSKSASFSAMVLAQPKKLVKLETPPANSQQLGEAGAYRLIRVAK